MKCGREMKSTNLPHNGITIKKVRPFFNNIEFALLHNPKISWDLFISTK